MIWLSVGHRPLYVSSDNPMLDEEGLLYITTLTIILSYFMKLNSFSKSQAVCPLPYMYRLNVGEIWCPRSSRCIHLAARPVSLPVHPTFHMFEISI